MLEYELVVNIVIFEFDLSDDSFEVSMSVIVGDIDVYFDILDVEFFIM